MAADPELKAKRLESHRKSYEKRREKVIEQTKKHIAKNKERYRQYSRTNAANRKKAKGSHTTAQWFAKFSYYGKRCAYCLADLSDKVPHRDHVIPVFKGGGNWVSNIAPSCKTCNLRKSTKRWVPKTPKPLAKLPQ